MSSVIRNNPTQPIKRRSRWSLVFKGILILIFGLLILAVILWTQRYKVMEYSARNALAKQGIDTELSIVSVTKHEAHLENVRLSYEGQTFFTAKSIKADYVWKDAINQKFDRIDLIAPKLNVSVDENGTVIDAWASSSGAGPDGEPLMIPPLGIYVRDGDLNLNSPYGQIETLIDGEIRSLEDIKGQFQIKQADVNYQGLSGQVRGDLSVIRKNDSLQIDNDLKISRFVNANMDIEDVQIKGPVSLKGEDYRLMETPGLAVMISGLESSDAHIGSAKINWDGRAQLPSQTHDLSLDGTWTIDTREVELVNTARRDDWVETLSLNETLSGISVSEPFAPSVTRSVKNILTRSDVKGAGRVNLDDGGAQIFLSEPLKISGSNTGLSLSTSNDKPFYKFDKYAEQVELSFDAQMNSARSFNLRSANLIARSVSGRDFDGVQKFSAKLSTRKTWHAETDLGLPARLAPVTVDVLYTKQDEVRSVRLKGSLDYDGTVPGGYATGLKADGVLNVKLFGEELVATFNPRQDQLISIRQLDNATDWVAENISFSLTSDEPVYTRDASGRYIEAVLGQTKGYIRHATDLRNFDFQFETADVSGVILETRQDWNLLAQVARMTSDSLPSPGTDIKTPHVDLSVTLQPDRPMAFNLETSETDVKTQLIRARELNIRASGSPNDIHVKYGDGLVSFSAGELPELPLEGDISFANNVWSGDAVSFLPKAEDAPIDVSYRFEDGTGTADVVITDLPFKSSGLQPRHLVSAFSGKIADVNGLVSSKIQLSFGADQPLTSHGTATLKDMDLGTLPGPIRGLNTQLSFSSIFPLKSVGIQSVTLDSFDPGLPLSDGQVDFEIIPDGIRIHSARWPIGNGFVSLEPTTWLYSANENRMTMEVENVSLEAFFNESAGKNFKATGNVNGKLPVVIQGVSVTVDDGRLSVKDGGVIEFRTDQTDAAGATNEIAGYAFDALKKFEYKELEARIDGPLDGNIELSLVFEGENPEILGGATFLFRVNLEGELFNIARSFRLGQEIGAKIAEGVNSEQGVVLIPD